jgi:hypothetical protein
MIIYLEDMSGLGLTAADVNKGGKAEAQWKDIADALLRGAERLEDPPGEMIRPRFSIEEFQICSGSAANGVRNLIAVSLCRPRKGILPARASSGAPGRPPVFDFALAFSRDLCQAGLR